MPDRRKQGEGQRLVPELPDVLAYIEALRPRVVGCALHRVRLVSPFVLRTVEPPLGEVEGRTVMGLRRLGKRVVLEFVDALFLIIHLMVAGRFRWVDRPDALVPARLTLAAFDFPVGTLLLTEAGRKKRASVHLVRGETMLAEHDRGGIEVLQVDLSVFRDRLIVENHTLKRALTDPRLFSGIGNAYSDEILHAARLSPVMLTSRLDDDQVDRLYRAVRETLNHWIEVLGGRFADRFPGTGQITAFRNEFAVHGKFGRPCPVCGNAVQRIRYKRNETNYCPHCQTGGRVLADRSLSRLLKGGLAAFHGRAGGPVRGR